MANNTRSTDLTEAKDWIYVTCTVFQTILAVVALIFVHGWRDRRKTINEWKRADIQREEDRQKADAEKIAAILDHKYYKIEDTFHRLKTTVDKLREKMIVDDWTEFHVLLYMCRSENWQKFNPVNQNSESETDPRDKLLSDVEDIMKFFLKLRINIFSIMQNKACPDDIKEEFSTKITEMGKTIYPFLEKPHRQDVIKKVLKYFEGVATVQESPIPQDQSPSTSQCCFRCPYISIPRVSVCCQRQEASEDETRRLTNDTSGENIEMQPSTSTSIANASPSPELINYPGNVAIEYAIPYVECFSYKSYPGSMELQFFNTITEIKDLMTAVESGKMQDGENEVLQKIKGFWIDNDVNDHEPPNGGLLHLIRMTMFERSKNRDFFNVNLVNTFKQYLKEIVPVETSLWLCMRMLHDINLFTDRLRGQSRSLLELDKTSDVLKKITSIIKDF